MIGAPPAKAAAGTFQDRIVKALLDLLATVAIGVLLGVCCAFIIFLLAALFGDVAHVTGERELTPAVLLKLVAPSLAAAKAGAINFTIARYLLLSKSRLRSVLPVLAGAAIIGGFLGLGFSELLGYKTPLITAEWIAAIFFWFTSVTVCRSDDNLDKDYLYYPHRGDRFP